MTSELDKMPDLQYVSALVFNKGVNPQFVMDWFVEFSITRGMIANVYNKGGNRDTIIDCALAGTSLPNH